MVEWVIIIAICLVVPVVFIMIKISWNVAKGGVDLMEFFGNAGKAGTVRQQSNDEINARKKGVKKKWGQDGKMK
jgi:hypothetical protein